MIYGYVRANTEEELNNNSIEKQIFEISDLYCDAIIYEEIFNARFTVRPQFFKLINLLNKNDILVITELDKFCISIKEGLKYVNILINNGVKIHILNMGIIENTAMGNLIIKNLTAFNKFEEFIKKQYSKNRMGRPKKFTSVQLKYALSLLKIMGGNKSYNEVSNITKISKSTLIREVNKSRT
ncbi:TPA: recombinase family protein [Clostridium botulinum]|nr:recombinase family protein [Clostridium botulinum]